MLMSMLCHRRFLLCGIVVCIFLSAGPRPVFHHHSVAAAHEGVSESDAMMRHLWVYHRGSEGHDESGDSWHLHWYFPQATGSSVLACGLGVAGGDPALSVYAASQERAWCEDGRAPLVEGWMVSPRFDRAIRLRRIEAHLPAAFYSTVLDRCALRTRFERFQC